MNIRIGIITTRFYEDYFLRYCDESAAKYNCSFQIFTVEDLRSIRKLYLRNKASQDGFVVTSKFLYDSIGAEYIDPAVPVHAIYEDESMLYQGLLRLMIENPGLDLTRVYMDFADVIDSFGEFKQYINGEGKPIDLSDIFLATETMLENHLNLWRSGKIDLAVTAFSHFVPALEKENVKYVLISSRFQNIDTVFSDIINQITVIKLKQRRTVVACLSAAETGDEKQLQELGRLTESFLCDQGVPNTVQILEDHVSLYTTSECFLRITSNVHNCALLSYITEHSTSEIKIGWGSGYDYVQADTNASKANRQAAAYPGSCSFYIDEEQHVTGPLQNDGKVTFSEWGNPQVIVLAGIIGLNNTNLQKIMYFLESRRTNKASSTEIASCLGVTRRGANRILNRIEERGYARVLFEKISSGKGRPQKFYELTFLNSEGVLKPIDSYI